ncbi:hypothetical protein TrLO_g11038 [Triparma laevis f. longispina]|uniref:Cyclin-dependent kinase 2 homolog n=1 Tax=Triparma laevis f. longispina TaxID=1714387 RepID=A0A9W7F8G3_9STRA|nr:hypothetical protein TrLO_g11038 [Triparma laevis f. longispina]
MWQHQKPQNYHQSSDRGAPVHHGGHGMQQNNDYSKFNSSSHGQPAAGTQSNNQNHNQNHLSYYMNNVNNVQDLGIEGGFTRTISSYLRIEQIGEGTYGQVYKSRPLHPLPSTSPAIALKKIRVHNQSQGLPLTAIREIKILKHLKHQSMVRMEEVVTSKGCEYLDEEDEREDEKRKRLKNTEASSAKGSVSGVNSGVMSANMSGSQQNPPNPTDPPSNSNYSICGNLFLTLAYSPHDLTGLMDMGLKFSPLTIKYIFAQLLDVLVHLHGNNYIHRDLKCSNILVGEDYRIQLADFGLARKVGGREEWAKGRKNGGEGDQIRKAAEKDGSGNFTNKVITLWYRPPELLFGSTRYSFHVDMWSAGCIFAELQCGRPILPGKGEIEQLQLISDLVGTPNDAAMKAYKDTRGNGKVVDVDLRNERKSKLREKFCKKMSKDALDMLERLLDLNPDERMSARSARKCLYFTLKPTLPSDGSVPDVGRIGMGGGNFHEFQTKKRRREAKVIAENCKREAIEKGFSKEEAEQAATRAQNDAMTNAVGKVVEDSRQKDLESLDKHWSLIKNEIQREKEKEEEKRKNNLQQMRKEKLEKERKEKEEKMKIERQQAAKQAQHRQPAPKKNHHQQKGQHQQDGQQQRGIGHAVHPSRLQQQNNNRGGSPSKARGGQHGGGGGGGGQHGGGGQQRQQIQQGQQRDQHQQKFVRPNANPNNNNNNNNSGGGGKKRSRSFEGRREETQNYGAGPYGGSGGGVQNNFNATGPSGPYGPYGGGGGGGGGGARGNNWNNNQQQHRDAGQQQCGGRGPQPNRNNNNKEQMYGKHQGPYGPGPGGGGGGKGGNKNQQNRRFL